MMQVEILVHVHVPYKVTHWLPDQAEVDIQHANEVPQWNLARVFKVWCELKFVLSVRQSLQPQQLVSILQRGWNSRHNVFEVNGSTVGTTHT